MGRDQRPRVPAQRVIGGKRLDVGDIERGAGEPAVIQRGGDRPEVHQAAARSVDEHGRALHQVDGARLDEVSVGGRQRRVEGDVVGVPQQLLDTAGTLDADQVPLGEVGIIGADLEAEGLGPGRHPTSDPAHPKEREPPSGKLVDTITRGGPATGADRRRGRDDRASDGEKQGEGVVGHLVQAVVGDVRHLQAGPGCCLDVDVVEADPAPRDDPATGRGGGPDDRLGDLGVNHQECGRAAHPFLERRLVRRGAHLQLQAGSGESRLELFQGSEDVVTHEDSSAHVTR